jgi:hypothetical protein
MGLLPTTQSSGGSTGGLLPTGGVRLTQQQVSPEQQERLGLAVFNSANPGANIGRSTSEIAAKTFAMAGVKLADDVMSSPLNPTSWAGVDSGDTMNAMANVFGPSLVDKAFYRENQGLVDGISAVAGGIATVVIGDKFIFKGLSSALATSTALQGSRLWNGVRSMEEVAHMRVLAAQKAAVETGRDFSLLTSKEGMAYLGARVANSVGRTARDEALIMGVLWNNEVVNQEGIYDDAKWIGIGMALGAAGSAIGARAQVRKNLLQFEDIQAKHLPGATGLVEASQTGTQLGVSMPMAPNQHIVMDSTEFTALAVAHRTANEKDAAPALISKNSAIAVHIAEKLSDTLEKVLTKGVEFVPFVREPINKMPEMRHLLDSALKADAYLMHGVREFGVIQGSIANAVKSKAAATATRMQFLTEEVRKLAAKKKPTAKEERALAKLVEKQNDTPMVLLNGSWQHPDSSIVKAAEQFDAATANKSITLNTGKTAAGATVSGKQMGQVVIDPNLDLRRSASTGNVKPVEYEKLSVADRFLVQEAYRRIVRRMSSEGAKDSVASKVTKVGLRLDTSKNNYSWLKLDVASELMDSSAKITVVGSGGKLSADQVRRLSLTQKAQKLLGEVGQTGTITQELRQKYNLPEPTQMEKLNDPQGDGFRRFLELAATGKGTHEDMVNALRTVRTLKGHDLIPLSDLQTVKTNGDFLNWNRDKDGNWMRPVVGYMKPESQLKTIGTRVAEEAYQAQIASRTAQMLTGAGTKAKFVPALSNVLTQMKELHMAGSVNKLIQALSTGIGNPISQLLGEILPSHFLHRNNPIMLAAARIRSYVSQQADAFFRSLIDDTKLGEFAKSIDSPAKAATLATLDTFVSFRPGWDLEEKVVQVGDLIGFELVDSMLNRKLLGVKKIAKGTLLQNPKTGSDLLVTAEAFDAIRAFNAATDSIMQEQNAIRLANGFNPIERKAFYVPTQDTKNKIVGFVFDENNRLVKGSRVIAESQGAYQAEADKILAGFPAGYSVRTKENLRGTGIERDIWSELGMDWIDHGYSSATAGVGRQAGGLTGGEVRSGAFRETLDWLRTQTQTIGDETIKTLLKEPIENAKMRALIEPGAVVGDKTKSRNIYDEYLHAVLGYDHRYRDTAIATNVLAEVEKQVDRLLVPTRNVLDLARRFGVSPKTLSDKKTYRQIQQELGNASPFATLTEYLESQGHRPPPELKKATAKFHEITTAVVLRYDVGHPIMNMLGLIPTIVAGAKAGAAPTAITLGAGARQLKMVDSLKVVKNGMARFAKQSDPRNNADMKWMVAHGDSTQSSLEYNETLDAVKSQAGFNKWFSRADDWLGYFSDKSENLSRQIAHFTGLELADIQGIQGMSARHNFAREFANAAISNYDPANRPELFNTAIGSLFGLFQSYTLNQYTKMFHWIEDGQYAAAGVQAAVQASMFGAAGTYGAAPLMAFYDSLGSSESGTPTLMDKVYHNFGPELGSIIMHGSIQELTDIALWTRGDTTVRVPVVSGQMPPAIDVMNRVKNIVTGVVSEALASTDAQTYPAMVELIQREMPNRMLKGIISVSMLGGQETDRYGAVMSQTQTWVDSIARVAGLRSARMQRDLEVYYLNKASVEKDAVRRAELRLRLRAAVRDAKRTGKEFSPELYFQDYLKSGGNPAQFRNYIRETMRDAVEPRDAEVLKRNLASPTNQLQLWRLNGYNTIPE